MRAMKNNKAVLPDNIPIEVCKCLGEAGIDIVWDLIRKIASQEKMPSHWRKISICPCTKRGMVYSNAPTTGASNCHHIL